LLGGVWAALGFTTVGNDRPSCVCELILGAVSRNAPRNKSARRTRSISRLSVRVPSREGGDLVRTTQCRVQQLYNTDCIVRRGLICTIQYLNVSVSCRSILYVSVERIIVCYNIFEVIFTFEKSIK